MRISGIEGKAEVLRSGAQSWDPGYTNQMLLTGDRVRTRENSRVTLLLSDQSVVRIGPLSEFSIETTPAAGTTATFSLWRGLLYFFHRDKPAHLRVITRTAAAAIEGTEFNLSIDEEGNTVVTVVDGRVRLSNEVSDVALTDGEQGVARPGQAPTKTAVINAINVIQWALYYPAILHLDDLELSPQEQEVTAKSRAAYQQGDLLLALEEYPPGRTPATAAEKTYYAAILLAAGKVGESQSILSTLEPENAPSSTSARKIAAALHQLIAAVKGEERKPSSAPELASEWMAESYYWQSMAGRSEEYLLKALEAAEQAVTRAPSFGFAWARLAELQFGFGKSASAARSLQRSLELSPRNPQALALQGFILASENKNQKAIESFNRAMGIDSALGNAWLGRGLCLIREGKSELGRQDLTIAAALEPQRSLLRSYLGKAYAHAGDPDRAAREMDLAKSLDPGDPTGWLYSALLKQQNHQINPGVRDLQKSQALNDNRQLYRSRLLLDQDRAVRSVNLARLYADADLGDVAVREAGRAVAADYANYSAHLFLANSFEVERRANLSNYRLEPSSFSEYLLANLLGPPSGRLLAQPVTHLEYTKLFEKDRLGLIANTEYFSRGAWRHSSAQFGTFRNSSYAIDADYIWEPGERFNQDYEIQQVGVKFKQNLTAQDSLYFQVLDYRSSGGDIAQKFSEGEINGSFRFDQQQTPTLLAGYHREWSPRHHTLILAGRFDDRLDTFSRSTPILALDRGFGVTNALVPVPIRHQQRSELEVVTAEVQHIAILGPHTLVGGVRADWSEQRVQDLVADPGGMFLFIMGIPNPISVQDLEVSSSRFSAYLYDHFRIADSLTLIGGLNYTRQELPVNLSTAPISLRQETQDELNPKLGLIWTPSPATSLRASYTRSLTGLSLGQSVVLEPTQVAGLVQTFRSPVPFSIVGELNGAEVETTEVVWEGRFKDTYLSLGGARLEASRDRQHGLYLSDPDYDPPPSLGLIREEVRFEEHAFDFSAHQLVGDYWSLGARYRAGFAELKRKFPEYLGLPGMFTKSEWEGWLHTISLSALFRHPDGFFGRAEALYFAQDSKREGTRLDNDHYWQVNLLAGYRFPRQQAEITLGVLNLFDRDHHLDPINQYANHPRSSTFYLRFSLQF